MPELCDAAQAMFDRVGAKYELENQKDLKDRLDFEAPVRRPSSPFPFKLGTLP